jgi:purine-binding chemotaxis protein CheW
MAQTTEDAVQLLVFELAGARFALELACLREVVRAVFITPLPGAPPAVEGVISVRGEVVPIYDLRLRFGLPPRPLHPDDAIVMAWTGERRVGIRCDAIEWLHTVPRSAVGAAPAFTAGAAGRRISGVARLQDGLALIHDLKGFLEETEAADLAGALAAHAAGDAPS